MPDLEPQINNEGSDSNIDDSQKDDGSQTDDQDTNIADDGKGDTSDTDGDKYKDVPFDKHPRWKELRGDLKETRVLNEQLVQDMAQLKEAMASFSKASTKEEQDEILSELEKLDQDKPESYKDLFKKFRELNKKADERDQKQTKDQETKISSAQEEANVKQLETQLDELVEMKKLSDDQVAEFTAWCADKLKKGGSVGLYGNFHAAWPEWDKFKTDSKPDDKNRRAIGASGGSNNARVKVTAEDMIGMTMTEAIRRGREAT